MKRIEFAQKNLLNRSCLSYLLYPASLLYAGLMLFRRKVLSNKGYRAPFKVISIGNISSGGSGKSPIAIALCQNLKQQGLKVAYASRGYKSKLENGVNLVSDGEKLFYPASVAGDEALMAATSLPGLPVFSGRRRKEVLKLAAQEYPDLDVMVLDDAFQHLKVARDLDIVVFDTKLALGNGFVIPAGYLREPLSALNDKCLCVFHHKAGATTDPELEHILRDRCVKVFHVHSRPGTIRHKGTAIDPSLLKDAPLTLISAIAHPASFENSVHALDLDFRRHLIFPDHYDFLDLKTRNELQNDPATHFLCTAKDAVKLEEFLADRLYILELETILPPDFCPTIIQRILQITTR